MPPARVEPWKASNRWARAFSGTPGPVSETSITTTPPSRRPVMRIWSRAGSRCAARLQRLHGIARDIDQHAEQLIVVGLHGEPALDRDDPADRHVEGKAERLVHLLDQRLDLDRLALGRRLLRGAVGQRRLAEGDGALERAHQLGREALHLRVGQRRQLVGEKLRGGEQIAQVVIDLGHRQAERRQPVLLMQHGGELALHGGKLVLGGADLVGAAGIGDDARRDFPDRRGTRSCCR